MVTILEAASKARITKQKVRYWLELLDIEMTKTEGKFYLPTGAVDLLISMQKAVTSGLSPAVAAVEIKTTQALPVNSPEATCSQNNQDDKSTARITELEKAVLLLASTVEKQNQLLSEQSKQIAAITTRLLPSPIKKPLPVKVWQPPEKKKPQANLLKRIWFELFNPTMLRATP
jgi:hypothetical protein